jgi:hypothetical protein
LQIIELYDVYDMQSSLMRSRAENLIAFDFPLHRKCNSPDPHSGLTKSMEVLPSSLYVMGYWCSTSPSRYSCSASSQVKYELAAFAYKEDEIVASLRSEIRIYDTETPLPPPIHLPHFPGEYVVTQEKSLRKLGFRGARLGVSVSEPPPLEICSKDGMALAAIPMRLCLQRDYNPSMSADLRKTNGFRMEMRLTSRLRIHSYFSSDKMFAHPTDAQSRGSPFLGTLCKYGKKYVRNLRVDSWKSEKGPSDLLLKDMTLLLPILENEKPAPTFFTPFLARRYSVALQIDVNSGWHKASFRLNIPLQIVYPEEPVHYERLNEASITENDQGRLPVYIR